MANIVGIMFGDVKGYSRLTSEQVKNFYSKALPKLKRKLDAACKKRKLKRALQIETWGDGIMCVHADLADTAVFAHCLTEEFDKPGWQRDVGVTPLLRIRVALHAGGLWGDTKNWMSKKRQLVGSEIVLPARLEPKVRPGEVWCTKSFKDLFKNPKKVGLYIQEVGDRRLAKKAGNAMVYRIHGKRPNEDKLRAIERDLLNADLNHDATGFYKEYRKIRRLLSRRTHRFPPIRRYQDWVEIGQSLLCHDYYEDVEKLMLEYRDYLGNLLGAEEGIRICCALANSASNRAVTDISALAQAKTYVEECGNYVDDVDDKVEVESIIAAQEKRIGVLSPDSVQKRNLLIKAHIHYRQVYIEGGFGYYPGINTATTAALLAALSGAKSAKKRDYYRLSENIAHALVVRFDLKKPENFWEAATLAEAHVLLGNGDATENAVKLVQMDKFNQRSFLRQMDILIHFDDLKEAIIEAAKEARAAITT